MARKNNNLVVTRDNWKPAYTKMVALIQKGLPDAEVAKILHYSPISVGRIRRSPYFKERLEAASRTYERTRAKELAEHQTTDVTMTKLEKAAEKAVNILVKSLSADSGITKQQVDTAKDILDRTGYKAREKLDIHQTHDRVYSPEEIESAQSTMLEISDTLERLSNRGTAFLLSGPAASRSDTDEDESDAETALPEDNTSSPSLDTQSELEEVTGDSSLDSQSSQS